MQLSIALNQVKAGLAAGVSPNATVSDSDDPEDMVPPMVRDRSWVLRDGGAADPRGRGRETRAQVQADIGECSDCHGKGSS